MKPIPEPPLYTPRNVIGLLGRYLDKRDDYKVACESGSFRDARDKSYSDLCKAENELVAALTEVLKR